MKGRVPLERARYERLGPHDRADFVCSREPTLQSYLVNTSLAKRDNERHVSAVYVLLDTHLRDRIAGYFTLPKDASLVQVIGHRFAVAKIGDRALNDQPVVACNDTYRLH